MYTTNEAVLQLTEAVPELETPKELSFNDVLAKPVTIRNPDILLWQEVPMDLDRPMQVIVLKVQEIEEMDYRPRDPSVRRSVRILRTPDYKVFDFQVKDGQEPTIEHT